MSSCYWSENCKHMTEPLPKPKALSGWMNMHECTQRSRGVGWDGGIVEPERALRSKAAKARVQRYYRGS